MKNTLIKGTLSTLLLTAYTGLLLADTLSPSQRPGDSKLEAVDTDTFKPPEKPQFDLPPVQQLQPADATSLPLQVRVTKIEFVGNTVFSADTLSKLTNPYLNKAIGSLELEEIRLAITNHYINNGYINSGASIPDQDLDLGVLKLLITEGRLTSINLQYKGDLNKNYITGRISPYPDQPLNILALQERLYLLQQNPRINRINAALGPGEQRGQSNLDIRVTDDKPYRIGLEFNNYRPTAVGEWQGQLDLKHLNMSGAGDTLDMMYAATDGLKTGRLAYSYPLAPDDTAFNIDLNHSDSKVTKDTPEVNALKIHSNAWSAKMSYSFPLYHSTQEKYLVDLALDRRHSASFISSTPINCQDRNGDCEITALRLTQSYLRNANNEVFSLRHTMSVGLKWFNSTVYTGDDSASDRAKADSRFYAWLIQGQYAKRYAPTMLQSIIRMDLQLTQEALLSMEQFSVGGVNSVRGYRENFLVRDNGFLASWEARLPLYKRDAFGSTIHTMTFVDYGYSWNHNEGDQATDLYSVGIGFRFNYKDIATFQVYWAEPRTDVHIDGTNLQDDGLHMSFRLSY